MQRRHIGAITSLIFATFWAALNWPWLATAKHPAKNLPVPWLLCGFFVVVAAGVAAGKRWARWLGLAAALPLMVLLPIALVGAYFLSFFGDQAFEVSMAAWFLAAIALSVALVVLLKKPLDFVAPAKQPVTASGQSSVWIPFVFSVFYVIGSWMAGLYAFSHGWVGLASGIGIDMALTFSALPSVLLIWLMWAWWSRRRPPRPAGIVLAVGFIIPFVVIPVAYAIFTAKVTTERQGTERQLANAHLSDITDELLVSAHGRPIGIRLGYTVRFDEGLDDLKYRPLVTLQFESPYVAMSKLRSVTDPVVAKSFGRGEYSFTEDFIPSYFPRFVQFAGAPQRADDRCFYWGNSRAKELAKDSEPKHGTIFISFPRTLNDHVSRRSSTSLTYSQRTFYDSAIGEGALDCQ